MYIRGKLFYIYHKKHMTAVGNLYTALGEVAYAIASADGRVQQEEKNKLNELLVSEFNRYPQASAYSGIIFDILKRDAMDSATAYTWALHEIEINSNYLSASMKAFFIEVIRNVAAAFPPVTAAENDLITDFTARLQQIHIDSVLGTDPT